MTRYNIILMQNMKYLRITLDSILANQFEVHYKPENMVTGTKIRKRNKLVVDVIL